MLLTVMAHASYLRDKARELRRSKKLTIDQLADRLALPRTTIYYWVRDMPIEGSGPGGKFPTHGQKMGTRAMQATYKRRRDEAYADGKQAFEVLAGDPTFRDFVCLYIAEGYKRDRNRVAVGNSDPTVVSLTNHWVSPIGSPSSGSRTAISLLEETGAADTGCSRSHPTTLCSGPDWKPGWIAHVPRGP